MAEIIIDGQKILTEFIDQYLQRPVNDPIRKAAEKWLEQQGAKTKARQPKPTGETSVGGVTLPKVTAPTPQTIRGKEVAAKAKAKTLSEQRKANDKARAAGAALPYPEIASGEVSTPRSVRQAEAGAGIQGPGLAGRDVRTPTITTRNGAGITPTPTGTPAPTGTGTGTGTGAGFTSASTTTTEATDKVKSVAKGTDAVNAAFEKLGVNRAVLKYMQENYPKDYNEIKKLIDNVRQDLNLTAEERNRVALAFKGTDYYKKAQVEKNRTKIGAYFIENGLDTISNAAEIDRLTSDVFVRKVNTLEQAQVEIRRTAAEKLGLLNSPDENKRKIGAAMIDGGQTFIQAANPYVVAYATALDIPFNEFNPFEDDAFKNVFNSSTSLADFQVKIKGDPRYVMSMKGRQEMDQTKLGLQRLTRALGLGYNPKQLEDQAQNIVSGKTTFEQIEYSLRSIAGEAFPSFKDRILAGDTIENIASPYVSSMSRILEIPDASIDISNPNNQIRKALIGDGNVPKPLWQFEQELFKDARWQYTSNARDTVDRVSMDILQRFGVMG